MAFLSDGRVATRWVSNRQMGLARTWAEHASHMHARFLLGEGGIAGSRNPRRTAQDAAARSVHLVRVGVFPRSSASDVLTRSGLATIQSERLKYSMRVSMRLVFVSGSERSVCLNIVLVLLPAGHDL